MKKTNFLITHLKVKNKNSGINIEDFSSEITFNKSTNFINKRNASEKYYIYFI